jgi:hypothetical protein
MAFFKLNPLAQAPRLVRNAQNACPAQRLGPTCWSNFTKVGLFRSGYDLKFLQSPFFLDNILFFLEFFLEPKNLEVLILYFKQF